MTSETGVVSFPIPPYQNLPIHAEFYQPSRFVISGVTLGQTTTITTTDDMNYVIGQQVRLLIPASFGCYQLNNQIGYVVSIPATNKVEVTIDSSRNVNAFISATATTDSPQILAIGDTNLGYTSSTGRNIPLVTIPGSFINIS